MAAQRFAWVLNLDADLELATGDGYQPRKSSLAAMQPFALRLATTLVGADDFVVDDQTTPGSAAGCVGRAYCPTPRALALLERAGAQPEPHPPFEVLRRVNSRAFASALGPTLPGAAFVTTLDEARTLLASQPPEGGSWRAKHAFGMSGRNQRTIDPRAITPHDIGLVEAWLRSGGGVQIEPELAIENEYALHALLAADGSREIGDLVAQRCDERGAWVDSQRIVTLDEDTRSLAERLRAEIDRVADALHDAGYFGPFGIDAFTYRSRSGIIALQRRSEINARYSMGFGAGLRRTRSSSVTIA